ncbi:MAG: bifunctional diaminohydroxyphosphoribosylaminopyrimidine deaminase/5-amino-6-(5-phosphoribosylamino)uracil reductase RibD [Bacteroidetes bacterium]|nr:bifunctional diaminohydroxyphosphoribosylaminopyrimidine deaminase/5-amino-6-(5-phosphoribosylamino)uracil reductase RibD [Bacteroidota bacterium]
MSRCLELAGLGISQVAPNPMVGCVITIEDRIISEGYHKRFGEAHAEVIAINGLDAGIDKEKLQLYVNLEPCSHHGKTPPCVDLIISTGIKQVLIGATDPNPKVSGQGIQKLKDAGCEVTLGIIEEQCKELNKRFYCFHQNKRPYIILKWAQSNNGTFAPFKGQRWITGEETKKLVHKWRTEESAIMIGTDTAKIDNPNLTNRVWQGGSPVRVVIDKNLRLSKDLNLFNGEVPTIILSEEQAENSSNLRYIKPGNFSPAGFLKVLAEDR